MPRPNFARPGFSFILHIEPGILLVSSFSGAWLLRLEWAWALYIANSPISRLCCTFKSEKIACIIILICFAASRTAGYTGLAILMIIYCTIIFIIFMLELHLQVTFIHWGWTNFIRALIGAVAFLIVSIVVFINHPDGAALAAAVIGILTGILFGYDAYTILPSIRKTHTAAPSEPTDGI